MNICLKFCVALILIGANCLSAASAALPGNGTQSDPYLIQSIDDFLFFVNPDNDFLWYAGVCTRLDADINLKNSGTFSQAPIAGDTDADQGFDGKLFAGVFDGNNKTISYLTVDSFAYGGLFGMIANSGTIKDLTLDNIAITCTGYYGGGVCGYNYGGNIINCKVVGTVSGEYYDGTNYINDTLYLGGLVGFNDNGTVINCHVDATVSGYDYTGILCGRNGGDLSDCSALGSVSGMHFVGGLCGRNNGILSNSNSSGNVVGDSGSNSVGGFCGHNSGTLNSCFSSGTVSGKYYLGGFCGYNNGNIYYCYTTSEVAGQSYLGGLCGFNYSGSISECLSVGGVSGSHYAGGLCGYNTYGSILNSFWNVDTSSTTLGFTQSPTKQGTEINVNGISTSEMYDINTYLVAGWDFVAESANGTDDLWHMPYNAQGAPMLFWQKDIPGDIAGSYGVNLEDLGELASEWIDIYTITDLETIAQYWLEGLQ